MLVEKKVQKQAEFQARLQEQVDNRMKKQDFDMVGNLMIFYVNWD